MEDPAPEIIPVCNELLHKTHFKGEKSNFNYELEFLFDMLFLLKCSFTVRSASYMTLYILDPYFLSPALPARQYMYSY